jgi:hypothetical protein
MMAGFHGGLVFFLKQNQKRELFTAIKYINTVLHYFFL